MKKAGILPHRYAKALFLVGKERGILDKIQEDWSIFVDALQRKHDFFHFFISPEVSRKVKEAKIEELFGDTFSNVFYNFILVILKNRRQNLILDIAEAFNGEVDDSNNRVKAVVTSAIELTPKLQSEIQDRLAEDLGKEIVLETKVNPALLGGVQITVNGMVIDGSVKGRLHKLRRFLLEKSSETLN